MGLAHRPFPGTFVGTAQVAPADVHKGSSRKSFQPSLCGFGAWPYLHGHVRKRLRSLGDGDFVPRVSLQNGQVQGEQALLEPELLVGEAAFGRDASI